MSQKATTKSAQFIFITAVLDMMEIGLIIPVLPEVIRRFVSSQDQLNNYFGYFVAIYALMQFFASPVLGSLSDRFGRRPVLLGSLLGSAIDYMFMAFAGTLPLLFLGRVISGLTGASMAVINSYMADVRYYAWQLFINFGQSVFAILNDQASRSLIDKVSCRAA